MTVNYTGLPEGLRGGAERWIEHGIQPGRFLSAVICNDLRGAVTRADADNLPRLLAIVIWWCHETPLECWGNAAAARAWAERHGRTFQP